MSLAPLRIGSAVYPTRLPPLGQRIAFRIALQDAGPLETPTAVFAGAGLCCPSLPPIAPKEDLLAYGERVGAWLSAQHPQLEDVLVYNGCDDLVKAMMEAMYPAPAEVEGLKNSSGGQEAPPTSNSSSPGTTSTATPSPSTTEISPSAIDG